MEILLDHVRRSRIRDHQPFIAYLRRLGRASLPLAVDLLEVSPQADVRAAAFDLMVSIGKEDIGLLVNLVQESKPFVARAVIAAIGEINDKAHLPILARFLNFRDPDVRLAAVGALGQSSDVLAQKILLSFLRDDSDEKVRVEAAGKVRCDREPGLAAAVLEIVSADDFVRTERGRKGSDPGLPRPEHDRGGAGVFRRIIRKAGTLDESVDHRNATVRCPGPGVDRHAGRSRRLALRSGKSRPEGQRSVSRGPREDGKKRGPEDEGGRMTNETRTPTISQKKANEVFVRLQAVFKLAIFYEPNNRIFKEQMDALLALIAEILQRDGAVQVDISKSAIFLNRLRLKFDFATFSIYKFMISEFQEREIGSLTLEHGLSEEEFTRFILFLAKHTVRGEDKFDRSFARTRGVRLPHILVGPAPPDGAGGK